jgi:hypothetical protein
MEQKPTYRRLKQVLFGGIIALLLLPMIQHKFRFFEEKPLSGAFIEHPKPALTRESWFSGKYQEAQELYITTHTGFRPGWFRLYNQWNYTLFNYASASGVVVGKNRFLYEENYIKAYYGIDFLGEQKIAEICRKWKAIQDTLGRKGIQLVVLLAPGKGSFYPEYIPDSYQRAAHGKTNFEEFRKQFEQRSIRYVDLHTWYESMKKTSKYPLFSKTGIHWTAYGQQFALDTMTKVVSHACGTEIPSLILDKVVRSTKPWLGDDDIGAGMNLFETLPEMVLGYPEYHPSRPLKPSDPKVLVIADSFYWGLFNTGLSNSVFNNGEFWYYNEQIYPATYEKETWVKDQDLDAKLKENKVVFFLITDANLYKFGFGFIEAAQKEYGIK